MTNRIFIAATMFAMYFMMGGLATTNILRLTSGNTLSVRTTKCICDGCGKSISPLLQLPIVSYIVCGGKCRSCGANIPVFPLILETIIFLGMSTITAFCVFSATGVVFSFIFYEIARVVTVAVMGKREKDFAKQYIIAVLSMLKYLALVQFPALLYTIV